MRCDSYSPQVTILPKRRFICPAQKTRAPSEEGKPITKTDMANKVYEQVGGTRKLTDSQKADLKTGINNIWSAIELTGEQAKLTGGGAKEL